MYAPRSGSEPRGGPDDGGADQTQLDDERGMLADEREAALDAREVRADARETAHADRTEEVQRILADADERDDQADARDAVATTRDTAASLHSFLHDNEYGPALKARRSAAMDRAESKTDRTSAAADRSRLTEVDPTPPDAEEG